MCSYFFWIWKSEKKTTKCYHHVSVFVVLVCFSKIIQHVSDNYYLSFFFLFVSVYSIFLYFYYFYKGLICGCLWFLCVFFFSFLFFLMFNYIDQLSFLFLNCVGLDHPFVIRWAFFFLFFKSVWNQTMWYFHRDMMFKNIKQTL